MSFQGGGFGNVERHAGVGGGKMGDSRRAIQEGLTDYRDSDTERDAGALYHQVKKINPEIDD